MTLTVPAERARAALAAYNESEQSRVLSILLLGETGVGKTYLLKTAPKPIRFYCFDPGGTLNLRDEISRGEVIPSTYIEKDLAHPSAWLNFARDLKGDAESGFLNACGTVAFDSLTTMLPMAMHFVMAATKEKPSGMLNGVAKPAKGHYAYLNSLILEQLVPQVRQCDCHQVWIGHLSHDKDEVTGQVVVGPSASKGIRNVLPSLYDEVYYMEIRGDRRVLLTQNNGRFHARSRLADKGQLEKWEPKEGNASLRSILKKCDYLWEDKPLFNTEDEKEKT